ncbi:calmin isoform X2 [Rhinatrema bivittatum]|uniref:calmin isoform X2 n=1 Tax=Rhinatrema bivittatum TaxID=194408 RepID=UPI00112649FC|nr:calmin isoform X2 [Rhinatrema bivittatum]
MKHTPSLYGDYRFSSSDIVERENVQKRTFTRWINLHLEKCNPPLQVQNLFVDIQDGKILMALLEVLSGKSLLHEYKSSSHRIFRLNNIAKALTFLEDSNVKLVSIDAAEIADGNSSLILGLIWNIILFFQIKEFTGNLNRMASSSSLSSVPSCPDSDTSQPSTPSSEKSGPISVRDQRKAIKALLSWVQERTRKYGVAVQDFASSWRSGLAFLAVIKAIDPGLVNMKQAFDRTPLENLEDAFSIAHEKLGIPKLLEPEDIIVDSPDEQSVMTYVAQFLEHFPESEGEDISETNEDIPLETTYVHIKDGPKEQEGTVFIFNQNGDYAYAISHESTQPPPQKINLWPEPDTTEDPQSKNAQVKSNGDLNPSLKDQAQPLVEEEEPPALLPAEPHRSNSWHALGTVHFQPDDSWHDLGNKWTPYVEILGNNEQEISRNDSLTVLPNEKNAVEKDSSELPPLEVPTSYSSEAQNLTDVLNQSIKTRDSLNTSGASDSESFGSTFEEPDGLVFHTDEHPSEKISSITSLAIEGKDLNVLMKAKKEEEAMKYISHLQEEEALKKAPAGCEHPQQVLGFQSARINRCLANDSRQKGQTDLFRSTKSEIAVPSKKILEPSLIHNGGGSVSEASHGSAKVSVIPHDLFYYPHYSVPISDVLDAFVKPGPYDSQNNDVSNKLLANGLQEQKKMPGESQQTFIKTNTSMFPAQMDKCSSRSATPNTCLNVEFPEMGSESANGFFSGANTNQEEEIDSVTYTAQHVFPSEDTNSVPSKRHSERELNYSGLTKTDSTSNGTTEIAESLEPIENHFEDASAAVLGQGMHGKPKARKIKVDEAQEESFRAEENRSAHLSDETEGDGYGNVVFLRPTSSDTNINYQQYNSTASDVVSLQDLGGKTEEKNVNILGEANVINRKKVKWEAEPKRKMCSEPEMLSLSQHFPDVLYFLLLLWLFVYLLLILPELSIGKVTFLQQ